MKQDSQISSFIHGLALLTPLFLAACGGEPAKPAAAPAEPVAAETPAPGSQAEADAVAEEAVPAEGEEATPAEETPAKKPMAKNKKSATANDDHQAEAHASVVAVLPPVWIFRGDLSTALLPGTAVYEGDRIETATDGRVQLTLDDGGSLQLGGNTEVNVSHLLANETSSLDGTLNVVKGSIAFESGNNGSLLPGDLDFTLGRLTAFITKAALMGKTDGKESLMCLLGGTAEISAEGQDPVTLDTPKSCVTTSKTAATAAGTAQQLKTLQQDLQPPAGLKAMKSKGTWALVFTSEGSEVAAKKDALKLWKAGYPAEVIEAKVKGKTYFRVALRGFESRDAANAFKKKRAAGVGYKSAWVNGGK